MGSDIDVMLSAAARASGVDASSGIAASDAPVSERPVCNVCGTTTCADDESGDDEAATSCAGDFQDEMRATGMTDEQRAKYIEAQKKLKRFLSKEVKTDKRIDVDALIKVDAAEGPFDDKPAGVGVAETGEGAAYRDFREAARTLKQAEQAYLAAQQAYAEAVKRLSEEAVR